MKTFIIKTSVFILLLLTIIYLYIFLLANNETDPFYWRFTTGKYKSLVLGTSRAAQGIEPGILNELLGLDDDQMYNYSFTVNRSQWGEPYHKSILKKLDTVKNSNGLFILECNLWAFCSRKDQIGSFIEKRIPPNNILSPNLQPNVQYFLGGFEHQNYRLLFRKIFWTTSSNRIVNKNGRFEVNVPYDSTKIYASVKGKVDFYEGMAREYVPDSLRMRSFLKTINYLKQFGSVYLIRMPVAEELLDLESSFYPGFNAEMSAVSGKLGVAYFDFSYLSNKYITSDGNHIHNKYVDSFNTLLASVILKDRTENSQLRGKSR